MKREYSKPITWLHKCSSHSSHLVHNWVFTSAALEKDGPVHVELELSLEGPGVLRKSVNSAHLAQ